MNLLKKYKYLILIIITSLFASFRWLSFSIFTYSDHGFAFSNTLKEISLFGTLDNFGLGSMNLLAWRLVAGPGSLVYGLFGILGFNSNIADKILVFWPWVILSGISSYFLVRKITKSNIGGLVGSFVFSFNTYFLAENRGGHLLLSIAFVFAVFSLLFFIKLLVERKPRLIVLTALSLFITASYDLRSLYIVLFVLFFYTLYYLIFINEILCCRKTFSKILVASSPIIIFSLLSIFWVLVSLKTGTLTENSVISRTLFGSSFFNITRAITLFHPYWTGGLIDWFIVQKIPFYFWSVPILAFLGLILNRKNKNVVFFGIIALAGIFLSKQIAEPFGGTYKWLFENFPGFNAFREASKFYFLITLGYSVLIGSFIDWLWRNCNKNQWRNIAKYGLTLLIIGLFLWNTKPIITGEIGSMFIPRDIPSDYLVLKDFILKQPEYFRTMWAPRDSRWGIYTNQKPKISNIGVVENEWKNLLETYNENEKLVQNRIINAFKLPFADNLFDISSVKYVIIPLQDKANDDDFFISYGGKENLNIRDWYISELDKVNWLKKIDIETNELVVYENENYKQPIFSFDSLYSFDSFANLDIKYGFIAQKLGGDFSFIITMAKNNTKSTTYLSTPFKNLGPENISTNSTLIATTSVDIQKKNTLYNMGGTSGNIRINGSWVPNSPKTSLTLTAGENDITYRNPAYSFDNLIPNGSFESGAWQEKVGDCHNYDNNPILAMSLNKEEKSDGLQSLQLEAARHIACNSIKSPIKGGSRYLLSFDYQSSNAKIASYYVGFDDKSKVTVSANIDIKDTEWHTFSKTISAPDDATTMYIFIYAKPTDDKENIVNRYDNVKLIEVPKLEDKYYLVSEPKRKLKEPKKIDFELINPTKKLVHIKGAITPFFLAMGESYHDQWQLELENGKNVGFFRRWWPFVKPDRVGDEYHYKLNGFLNAWYVDTENLCQNNSACVKNSDGSYDMEMVIEFWPQRWFYLGLIISGTTLLGCLSYLVYDFYRRRKLKNIQHV